MNELRANWGSPKQQELFFGSIERYAEIMKENNFHQLSSQTMEDIDLQGLFAFIDRTTSRVGQQFLYKKIVQPGNNPQDELKPFIELFGGDEALRLEIQQELLKLNHADSYSISSLLQGRLIAPPRWFKFL